MKVLVTGGTGLIGAPTVRRLLDHGHSVRLVSRHAEEEAAQFQGDVEAWNGSIERFEDICGSADGCDAVVHIAGIVQEELPDTTFENVNIGGTRNMVEQARRAEVATFIYVSSLGADRGESAYHKSKLEAEEYVRAFQGNWAILRPGNVYGPGDEVVSLLIRMVRSLPAVPVLDGGDKAAQPIWAGDLAEAIVQCVEREDAPMGVMEVAGRELVTTNEMLDRLAKLLGKDPLRVPVPSWAAHLGSSVAQSFGFKVPFTPDQVTMMLEGSVIQPNSKNALVEAFGIEPTPLDEGLRKLIEAMPEQKPSEGVGSLRAQRYEVAIGGSRLSPEELFAEIASDLGVLFRSTVVSAGGSLTLGETLDLELPIRGTSQVRVVDRAPTSATVVTVKGHPLSGCVMFSAAQQANDLLFRIDVFDKPADLADAAAMALAGRPLQKMTWQQVVQNVVDVSGGTPRTAIMSDTRILSDEEARAIEEAVDKLVAQWKQSESNPARLI